MEIIQLRIIDFFVCMYVPTSYCFAFLERRLKCQRLSICEIKYRYLSYEFYNNIQNGNKLNSFAINDNI